MSYYATGSPSEHDESPWMSDEDEMAVDGAGAPSQPSQLSSQSAVSQQEWDKLSLRFSDVSRGPDVPFDLIRTRLRLNGLPEVAC